MDREPVPSLERRGKPEQLEALRSRLESAGDRMRGAFESEQDGLVVRDPDGIELRFEHHA